MNSKFVTEALQASGALRFRIPASRPDANCIENTFHAMRKKIQVDAVFRNISWVIVCETGLSLY